MNEQTVNEKEVKVSVPVETTATVIGEKKIKSNFGARGAHIAHTLMNDSEYIHYILLWAVVFSALLFGTNRIYQNCLRDKKAKASKNIEEAFSMP